MTNWVVAIAVAVFMWVTPVSAFQEGGEGKPLAAAPGAVGKPLDLSTETKPSEKGVTGTVRIPGLGALGVLPKLDFGLELLYGDPHTGERKSRQDPAIDNDSDGLRIKGTLKHRF